MAKNPLERLAPAMGLMTALETITLDASETMTLPPKRICEAGQVRAPEAGGSAASAKSGTRRGRLCRGPRARACAVADGGTSTTRDRVRSRRFCPSSCTTRRSASPRKQAAYGTSSAPLCLQPTGVAGREIHTAWRGLLQVGFRNKMSQSFLQARAAFQHFDTSGDGALDKDEIREALAWMKMDLTYFDDMSAPAPPPPRPAPRAARAPRATRAGRAGSSSRRVTASPPQDGGAGRQQRRWRRLPRIFRDHELHQRYVRAPPRARTPRRRGRWRRSSTARALTVGRGARDRKFLRDPFEELSAFIAVEELEEPCKEITSGIWNVKPTGLRVPWKVGPLAARRSPRERRESI